MGLSAKILQARRDWQEIFKVLKDKNLQPGLLYPAKISFKVDGEIKSYRHAEKKHKIEKQQMYTKKYKEFRIARVWS